MVGNDLIFYIWSFYKNAIKISYDVPEPDQFDMIY